MSEAEKKPAGTGVERCMESLERVVALLRVRLNAEGSDSAPIQAIGVEIVGEAGEFTVMAEKLEQAWVAQDTRPWFGIAWANRVLDEVRSRYEFPDFSGVKATEEELRELEGALELARLEPKLLPGTGAGIAVGATGAALMPFVATSRQKVALEALRGRFLKSNAWARESRLDKRGLMACKKELEARGLVKHVPRKGFYRPDDPPAGWHLKDT